MKVEIYSQNSIKKRLLEVLSVTIVYGIMTYGFAAGVVATCFMLYTKFWFVMILYLLWIWVFDSSASKHTKRESVWVRNWKLWEYARNYLSIKLITAPGFELDSTKNYLFCCHPHSVLPFGTASMFMNHGAGYWKFATSHKFYYFSLKLNFMVPFYRELLLAMGFCQVSAECISYILSKPSGGNVGMLYPGGAAEAYNSYPGTYHLVLKNRKGFIKLALKNGFSIVPLISFREVDVFYQIKNSFVRSIQDWLKFLTGIALIMYYGRGYLPIPYRKPISVVVGVPIPVRTTQNPSQEEIDLLHNEYIQRLTELFEEHKHHHLLNADNTILTID